MLKETETYNVFDDELEEVCAVYGAFDNTTPQEAIHRQSRHNTATLPSTEGI